MSNCTSKLSCKCNICLRQPPSQRLGITSGISFAIQYRSVWINCGHYIRPL